MSFQVRQTAVVVDASVVIPILQDEGAWGDRMEAWIRGGDMLLVPPIFGHEVANALFRSLRLAWDDVLIRLPKLQALGLEVADRGWRGIERSIELADRHGLTVYDAAYLDLAIDVDAELATEDGELRRAARTEGVVLADE